MGAIDIKGWGMCGSARDAYSAERTEEVYDGKPVVRLWREGEGSNGFGSMYQMFKAGAFHGKRVRFSAAIRTVNVTGRAALCLRVDGPTSHGGRMLAFDNMDDRTPIKGTTQGERMLHS